MTATDGASGIHSPARTMAEPDTPFLALSRPRVEANVARLRGRLQEIGTPLRAHVKTAKCVDVARLMFDGGTGPIAVSTLVEAEEFAAAGFTDVLYAVGIAPRKLDRVASLRERGVDLAVLLDSHRQAEAVAAACRITGDQVPALIEIDCDGHRGGLRPEDPALVSVAATLAEGGAQVRGVLAHAGESYFAYSEEALVAAAENERGAAVRAADVLRAAGHAVPVVSIGSTPTAHSALNLAGVTEVRAGNFVFFDLVMAGIGVCRPDNIALSVVTTVIGHRPDKGWIITDGGWMATSRDRGTSCQAVDQSYGLVTAIDGRVYPDLLMTGASQEHGILALRETSTHLLPNLPIGTRVCVLPIHACATAAQHDSYQVFGPGRETIEATWHRIRGW